MMATTSLKLVQGGAEEAQGMDKENENVSLDTLSLMTGFPVEFIKSELIVDGDDISMSNLRKTMVNFLEKNKEIID